MSGALACLDSEVYRRIGKGSEAGPPLKARPTRGDQDQPPDADGRQPLMANATFPGTSKAGARARIRRGVKPDARRGNGLSTVIWQPRAASRRNRVGMEDPAVHKHSATKWHRRKRTPGGAG